MPKPGGTVLMKRRACPTKRAQMLRLKLPRIEQGDEENENEERNSQRETEAQVAAEPSRARATESTVIDSQSAQRSGQQGSRRNKFSAVNRVFELPVTLQHKHVRSTVISAETLDLFTRT